jgi:hypothetical protein
MTTLRLTTGALEEWLQDRKVHVWVIEYGITHSVMRLAIHEDNIFDRVEVLLGNCDSYCGPLQGGPFDLRLVASDDTLLMEDSGGELRIVAGPSGRIQAIRVQGPLAPTPWP